MDALLRPFDPAAVYPPGALLHLLVDSGEGHHRHYRYPVAQEAHVAALADDYRTRRSHRGWRVTVGVDRLPVRVPSPPAAR